MADEANFCLNCGENLAKWRTGSGFVREVAVPARDGPPAGAPPAGPPSAGARAAPPDSLREASVEASARGAELVRPVSGARHLNALLAEARGAAESRDLDRSLELFREALELDPDAQDALYGIGVVFGERIPALPDQVSDASAHALIA